MAIKKITTDNWQDPDLPKAFPGILGHDWVKDVMEPQMVDQVPDHVRKLFEVARSSIVYGWYFYPLLTLATEQLYRVAETAVRARCDLAGISISKVQDGKERHETFDTLVGKLRSKGLIAADALQKWHAKRAIRNSSSHPTRQTIITPGMAIASVQSCALEINRLFSDNPDYFGQGARVRRATRIGEATESLPIVVGIDVGDVTKGYHLVALKGTTVVAYLRTRSADHAGSWCSEHDAVLVAVDAPCGWASEGKKGREAERMLRLLGHSAHPTPTRARAELTPFFSWMLNGERLYTALQPRYPIFRGNERAPYCFETYPHLACCAFAGRRLRAADKKTDRRDIVRAAGIDDSPLRTIDDVDAAICALVAYSVHRDYCVQIGDAEGGFIVSPPLT